MRSLAHLVPPWLTSLVPYQPGKPIEEVERELGISDSIKLASNENPLGPSPKAVAAVAAAVADIHRYPDGGSYRLRQRLAEFHGVSPDRVALGNGSNEILELLTRIFLRPGDRAVMGEQAFVVYRLVAQAAAGVAVPVPFVDHRHDLEAMAAAIDPTTRIVFLANPNNPTGTMVDRAAFEAFLAAVPRDVVIVVDEAYFEYVSDPGYPDSLRYHDDERLIVTVRTFSKIYGLAGLRVGYAIATPPIVDMIQRVREPFNVNSLAQAGALAALDDVAHVEASRAANTEGLRYLESALREAGFAWIPSVANFLLVEVDDGAAATEALLRQGVIVRPMAPYGYSKHLRLTVGTADENRRAVAAFAALRNPSAGA